MGFFGPSKDEIWKQLSEEINAEFIDAGFWKGTRVKGKHNNWIIYLDTYHIRRRIITTRMRAPFINKDNFYFRIYQKGIFSEIGKAFGMQDIEVGYEEFDNNYIIQGNDENKVRKLFNNQRIRDLIEYQPSIKLEIKDNEDPFGPIMNENENELYVLVPEIITDIDSLKCLFELFSEVLEELELIGSASGDAPSVQLY